MKKYLYLLVPLTFGVFAGNDEHLSYYVIKDCEIYTATRENPTISVKKIKATPYEISELLWTLSFCQPNEVIRGKNYIPSLNEGDSHFEIVNTMSKDEYVKKIGGDPDDDPLTRTHNVSYENEKITEEVRVWREKIEQARDMIRYNPHR